MQTPFAAYTGSDPYVFVCYAHRDAAPVYGDMTWLHEQGVNIWYDEGISAGARWRDEIAKAIDGAALLIFFVSDESTASSHCLREVDYAADRDLPIVTVFLGATELPPGLRLALLNRQGLQRHRLPLDDYRHRLRDVVRRLFSPGTSVQSPPVATPSRQSTSERLHLGVQGSESTLVIAADLMRYLSWQGGIYRVHEVNHDAASGAVDFLIAITGHNIDDNVELQWQVTRPGSGELIWTERVTEPGDTLTDRRARIAEIIGEGALRKITESEIRRTADVPITELGYSNLVMIANQLNYLDAVQVQQKKAALERAVSLEPNAGAAHASLAALCAWEVLNGIGETDVLMQELRRAARVALQRDGDDPFVLLSVGTTYARLGQHEDGLELIQRACDMAPTVAARDMLARSLCFAGRPEEAIPLYEEIIATMPTGSRYPFVRLVVALVQAGRLKDALPVSRRAILHYPGDHYTWIMHANLLMQLGEVDEAREAFSEVMRLVPGLKLDTVVDNTVRAYGRTEAQRQWLTAGTSQLVAELTGA